MNRTGFYLYASNRMEVLSDAFSNIVQEEQVLAPHIAVVPNSGMEQWVSQEVALKNGICANTRFYFPNRFFNKVCDILLKSKQIEDRYQKPITTLKLYSILNSLEKVKQFPEIDRYLFSPDLPFSEGSFRRFQFAEMMAELYDQYIIFRPHEINQWDRGKLPTEKQFLWQGRLWRELTNSLGRPAHHRAWQLQRFLEVLTKPLLQPFPFSKISVFGISYLPPFYLTFFAALSKICEVHWFALNPSQE